MRSLKCANRVWATLLVGFRPPCGFLTVSSTALPLPVRYVGPAGLEPATNGLHGRTARAVGM